MTWPRLPFTYKSDLWDSYPFGLLAVPRSEVVAVHGSSGTGGRPTLICYYPWGPRGCGRGCARGAWPRAGATKDSVVHDAFGYGLFTGGIGIHQGTQELGATVVPVSGGMTPRQVTLIAGSAAGHPDLHAVVRDPARRGAGRGWARPGNPGSA